MTEKIKHWLILEGSPRYCGLNRRLARNLLANTKRNSKPLPNGTFYYIGKVVQRGKRQYIILEC